MHCPRCGQQQVSEDIKFCSRCGLPLGVVSEVVAQGGYLPQLDELRDQKKTVFNKKNGVVFSVVWTIFCIFLAIVFDGILNINRVGEFFVASGFFGGILIFLISLVYLPSSKTSPDPTRRFAPGLESLHGRDNTAAALPPQQTYPVSSYSPPAGEWRAPDTGQFAFPGSVTDNTTKLLKEDEE